LGLAGQEICFKHDGYAGYIKIEVTNNRMTASVVAMNQCKLIFRLIDTAKAALPVSMMSWKQFRNFNKLG
jgi:hypothetical protein